jgi:hypothetical protein
MFDVFFGHFPCVFGNLCWPIKFIDHRLSFVMVQETF